MEPTKAPIFNGDDFEFPEFKRKRAFLVTKANLPEETQIDKHRDSTPVCAKDQLNGMTNQVAWIITNQLL